MNELARKAVILARGLGNRMRSASRSVVLTTEQNHFAANGIKALIPVSGGKTLLELILADLSAAGFCEFYLVIGPEHFAVRDFCLAKNLNVSFAIQRDPLGTADAVLAMESFISKGELFAVVNSDNVYPVKSLRILHETDRPAMLAFERDGLIKNSNIPAERIAKFATVEIEPDGRLRQIVEKPDRISSDSLVSMNAWLFSPAIFAACSAIEMSERGEYEIAAAVQYAIDVLGEEFIAIRTAERVLDLSSRADIDNVGRFLASEN